MARPRRIPIDLRCKTCGLLPIILGDLCILCGARVTEVRLAQRFGENWRTKLRADFEKARRAGRPSRKVH